MYAGGKPTHRPSSVTPRTTAPQGIEVNVPGAGDILLTRRHFLYGVAGVAALAAIGGTYAYTSSQKDDNGVTTLQVPENAVFTTEDCTKIEDSSTVMPLTAELSLPYGTLVWSNSDNIACALLPTETSKPLAQIGLIALGAGTCSTVVAHAIGESEGFEIYDVRACDDGIIWTEADILEGTWRVYHASMTNMSLGQPVMAEEGSTDWEMPTLAASSGYAFWQLIPKKNGPAKSEDSKLKRAAFGAADSEIVYLSHGRMATAPCASSDSVTIAPRADVSGVYYQLTNIDAKTAKVTDALTLPASMRPFEVSHGTTGFSFSFDGIYNYGGGIANLGTYTPASPMNEGLLANSAAAAAANSSSSSSAAALKNATASDNNAASAGATSNFSAITYSGSTWFRFPRTPVTAPAWCGKWFVVKSSRSVCGVDYEGKQFFTLDVENGADSYGDFLASTGTVSRLVTFSNIDHTPLGGQRTRHCHVRIWTAV